LGEIWTKVIIFGQHQNLAFPNKYIRSPIRL